MMMSELGVAAERIVDVSSISDMNVDTPARVDMCADMCMDMCVDMCVAVCVDMCAYVCLYMWVDMCQDMHAHAFGYTCV